MVSSSGAKRIGGEENAYVGVQGARSRGDAMNMWKGIAVSLTAVVVLAGCGSSGNEASGVNAALAEYAQAQGEFGQTEPNANESTVTQAWLDEKAALLATMRASFDRLRTEAESVNFPEQAGGPGEPSQATVDEYLAATEDYIVANEVQQMQVQSCVDAGGPPFDCAMQVGVEALIGVYPDVLKRAQAAALELQSESSRG